jgi:hypothetical protein
MLLTFYDLQYNFIQYLFILVTERYNQQSIHFQFFNITTNFTSYYSTITPIKLINYYWPLCQCSNLISFRINDLLLFGVCPVDRCFSFCTFSFRHYVVCSLIYGFWLSLWSLQSLLSKVIELLTISVNHIMAVTVTFSKWWLHLYRKEPLITVASVLTSSSNNEILIGATSSEISYHLRDIFALWCSTYREHFTVLCSFMTYYWICNYINTTSATSGSGSTDPSGVPEFTPVFSGTPVTRPLALYVKDREVLTISGTYRWSLCHRYSITVNHIMAVTVTFSKWWLHLYRKEPSIAVASVLAASSKKEIPIGATSFEISMCTSTRFYLGILKANTLSL